jgi:hypothetical protein
MANTQGLAISFKEELFTATHDLTANSLKAALYLASATTDNTATAYTATGEVSGTNYTAGGVAVSNFIAPAATGAAVYTTPNGNIAYSSVTLSTAFDAVMIYNASVSNKAIGVWTFGSQTVTAGDLTLTMPTNDSTHALIQLT